MVEQECHVSAISTCTVISSHAVIKHNSTLVIASGGHVQVGSYFLNSQHKDYSLSHKIYSKMRARKAFLQNYPTQYRAVYDETHAVFGRSSEIGVRAGAKRRALPGIQRFIKARWRVCVQTWLNLFVLSAEACEQSLDSHIQRHSGSWSDFLENFFSFPKAYIYFLEKF